MRVESIGVHALDNRRVDVAVDLTPCREALAVELVIVGPAGDELCSALLLEHREPTIDRVLHLKSDAGPGEYVLHVGLFLRETLLYHATRRFSFCPSQAA